MSQGEPLPAGPSAHAATERGEEARERLLSTGRRLFAHQGFSRTSTRELAEAASVNVAAISYYFGDKAGLYRAAFFEPCGQPDAEIARFSDPALPLPEALRGLFAVFLEPLKHGDAMQLCMKLRFREMLEPTGLWEEEMETGIQPLHQALVGLLVRHLGLPGPDADVQRLALSVAGLGVHLHVGRDIADKLAPGLIDGPQAVDAWADRLVRYALGMVRAEAERRAGAGLEGGLCR